MFLPGGVILDGRVIIIGSWQIARSRNIHIAGAVNGNRLGLVIGIPWSIVAANPLFLAG